jgi:hypothetical protein
MTTRDWQRGHRLRCALRRLAWAAIAAGTMTGAATEAGAASLDGAGRIVILPYAVSGLVRESTIYVTNPSQRPITVHALYVGAEGTPSAASVNGVVFCGDTRLAPGESIGQTLSSLCPISTPDVENVGYLEFITYGAFDSAPFEVTSLVDVKGQGHFGVEGVPSAAFDPGRLSSERGSTLRVKDLIGDVGSMSAEFISHCMVATLSEPKTVEVQLQEYSSGVAKPLGSAQTISLQPWRMEVLGDIFRRAGLPPGRFANITAEFYAVPSNQGPFADGADVIASCSVENPPSQLEDVRLAETPAPRDHGRSRSAVVGDSNFRVGPFQIGYGLPLGKKARMSVYLRHEDRVRCFLTESVVKPGAGIVPWQELRVIDPDGNLVAGAGGSDRNDTGVFFTGPKNGRHKGVNDRWTIEISWREIARGDYSQIPRGNQFDIFGIECTSTNGLSQLLPLDTGSDDF